MAGEKEEAEPDIILYTISKKSTNWLSKKGYDGLMGADGEHKEIVVFNPAQIKATNNSGNFSNTKYIYEMPQYTGFTNDDSEVVSKAEKFYDRSEEIDYDTFRRITYTLMKDKEHHGIYLIIQDEDDEFIGYIKANPFYKLKNAIQIQMTEIVDSRQQEGIGTHAYEYLLTNYDYIVSDEQLTDGSTELYRKLAKKYSAKIWSKDEGLLDIDFSNLSNEQIKKYDDRKDVYFVLSKK
jgi:hypothetical protein